MTKRERYLKALHNEPVDEIIWAPNFDYWLNVNTAEGTLPEKYIGMSRNDIVRTIGGYIWNRSGSVRSVQDPAIKHEWRTEGEVQVHEIRTPVGAVYETYRVTEGAHRTKYLAEHFIKDVASINVMKYIVQGTHYEPDYAPAERALAETGEDGIVITGGPSVPFIQYAKMDAGYVNAYYLWTDHRAEVDSLVDAYFASFLECYRIVADGPGDVIGNGDNMDGLTLPPNMFREYAIPFYQEVRKIIAPTGKLYEGHWCGRTQSLLTLVPGCGLDVVEAIVTTPMADVTLQEALDMLRGEVVLQGGIPSVLVCEEGGTREDFVRYVQEIILPLRGRKGFILGMSDNVPPNADFARVEAVAELIQGSRTT